MGKPSRTYLWAECNLWAYNLQPLGRIRVLGKGIGEPRLKREGTGEVGKVTLSANEATNVFPGKTPQNICPHKTTKSRVELYHILMFLSSIPRLPLPNCKLGLMRAATSIIWYPNAERGWLTQKIYSTKIPRVPTVCQAILGTSQWTKTGTKKASSLLELTFQWGKPTS